MITIKSTSISINNINPIYYTNFQKNNDNNESINYPISNGKIFYFLLDNVKKNVMNISLENFIELQKRYKDINIEILDIYINDRNTNGSILFFKDLPPEWYFKSIANNGTNIKYSFKNNEKQHIIDYLKTNNLGLNTIESNKDFSIEENNLYTIKKLEEFNEDQFGKICKQDYIPVFLKHIQDSIEGKDFKHYEKRHNFKVNINKIVKTLKKEKNVVIKYNNEEYSEYQRKKREKTSTNFYEFKIIKEIDNNQFLTSLFCTKTFNIYYFRFKNIDKKWNFNLVIKEDNCEFIDYDQSKYNNYSL